MATVTLPYKLQIWLPETVRDQLKALAHQHGVTLQELMETIIAEALITPPLSLSPGQKRRKVSVA